MKNKKYAACDAASMATYEAITSASSCGTGTATDGETDDEIYRSTGGSVGKAAFGETNTATKDEVVAELNEWGKNERQH